jgi:hypothetical protein
VTAAPEYHGHEGVRQLFRDARGPWSEFRIDPEDFVEAGDRAVVFVHVSLTDMDGSLTLDGRLAHVLGFRDDLVVSSRPSATAMRRSPR